jgi:hypothetical protein
MTKINQQQDTSSTGGELNSSLNNCDDVQVSPSGTDLIISPGSANSLTAEVTVVGTNCRSVFVCVWDGQRWICS